MKPAIVLLSGLPGTGKTTFAAALAPTIGAAVVESDAVRRGLVPRPDYSRAESARVFDLVEQRVRQALAEKRPAIVDATNVAARDRERFVNIAASLPCALVAVRLTAPDSVIRERLANPREGYSEATVAIYEMMLGRQEPFDIPTVVIDTSHDTSHALALVASLLQ